MRRRTALVLLGALVAAPRAIAAAEPLQSIAPPLQGIWTATSRAGAAFRGAWEANVAAATPNDALGSWTMTDEMGQVHLQGTWSARKTPRGWRGAWSARTSDGNLLSGSWEADDRTLRGAKTFGDLLKRTAQTPIAGVWRSGHVRGDWWLQARH
jgi:hypothetical protein